MKITKYFDIKKEKKNTEMSESKSEMSTPLTTPVGNLRNRIDNNLKLSIPKSNTCLGHPRNQPSTAPAMTGMKNQFCDLKNLMKNWEHHEMDEADDYFVSTPGSIINTPSSLKRKNLSPLTSSHGTNVSFAEHSPLVSQFMDTSKLSPILQVS